MTTLPLPLHRPPNRRPNPRATPDLDAHLLVVADLAKRLDKVHNDLAVAVVCSRVAGASWARLADALGVASKTVFNRYADLPGAKRGLLPAPAQRQP